MKPVLLAAALLALSRAASAQCCPIIYTPPNLPAGFAGTPYSQTLTASDVRAGWSLNAGALPAGLSLSSSGVISGVPTGAGTSIFFVTIDGELFGQTFSLTILPGSPRLVITPTTLPSASRSYSYLQSLAAGGGVPPYAWSLTSGALPAGLTLAAGAPGATGAVPTAAVWIQGAPTAAAVSSAFTVTVTDSTSAAASQPFTLAITPLTVTTSSTLPAGALGAPYSQTLAATGGAPPYSWSLALGALPPGLSLSSAGVIAGTPAAAGTAVFTTTVTDANSGAVGQTFTLSIAPFPCASLNYSGQSFGAAGGWGTVTVTASSGCRWTSSSQLSWVAITAGTSGSGNGAVAFQVTANSGAARSGAISIDGLPFTVEQSAASPAGLSTIGSIAQVVSGGEWESTITIVNTGSASEEAVVSFFDDNGNPLALPVDYPQAPLAAPALASSIDRTVGPGAELLIETAGPPGQTTQAGWALVQASGSLTGCSLFQWATASQQQEAVAALENRTPESFLLSFDQTGGYVLGIAVANASSPAANVTAALYDDAGVSIGGTTLPLPALGHTAFMLTDKFPAAAGRRGTLVLTPPAGAQISTIAFRANNDGSLATVLPLTK